MRRRSRTCGDAAPPPTATSAAQPEWARSPSAAGGRPASRASLVHGGVPYYAWMTRAQAVTLTAAIDVVLDCADGRLRAERRLRVLKRPKS